MHRLILILCCLIGAAAGSSAAPAQYAFRISFTDKKGAPALAANPAWLSARSIARRANFGIALDSTDRPVSPLYVDTVLQLTGGVMHHTSRWLNHCVVLLTDSAQILNLAGKNYIQAIAWVGYFDQGLHLRLAKSENPKFAVERGSLRNAKITGSSTYYGATWTQTTMVNGDHLHDQGFTGKGKIIAVLDDGFLNVDIHSGLDSLRQRGRLLETYNFKRNTTNVYTDGMHGTNCLSTMAGYKPGVYVGTAPDAQYALYATEDATITDAMYELDNMIAAIERADSLGADVISASVVYNIFFSPYYFLYPKAELDGKTTIVSRAVNMAVAKGIFYTSSAGNEGGNFWNYINSPGDADSALTVGSVNSGRTVSDFSSPGPNASGRVKPDVCLLGEPAAIFTGSNSISTSSGTSFAAPQAAGYAACLMEAYPRATPYQIREAIIRSADTYTMPTPKRGYGIPNFGIIHQFLKADSPAGIPDLQVVPNPFSESITVILPPGAASVEISLYDVVGRKIKGASQQSGGTVVLKPASTLPRGLYILNAYIDGKAYIVKLVHD